MYVELCFDVFYFCLPCRKKRKTEEEKGPSKKQKTEETKEEKALRVGYTYLTSFIIFCSVCKIHDLCKSHCFYVTKGNACHTYTHVIFVTIIVVVT